MLQFREFREVTLFDETGAVVATSRVGPPRITVPADPAVTFDGVSMSPIRVDDDQLPTSVFAVELKRLGRPAGWLVGEISLEEMWRMVDEIRIGQEGYALLVAPDGTLLAHGNPDRKTLVAQSVKVEPPLTRFEAAEARQYLDDGRQMLAVEAPVPRSTGRSSWSSRHRKRLPPPRRLQRQLLVAIGAGLLVMLGVGLFFGRRFIAPIFSSSAPRTVWPPAISRPGCTSTRATSSAIWARPSTPWPTGSSSCRKTSRSRSGRRHSGVWPPASSTTCRIPFRTSATARGCCFATTSTPSRARPSSGPSTRAAALRRFMDDLRNIVKPKPIERFPMEINAALVEIVDAMKFEGDRNGIAVEARYADGR